METGSLRRFLSLDTLKYSKLNFVFVLILLTSLMLMLSCASKQTKIVEKLIDDRTIERNISYEFFKNKKLIGSEIIINAQNGIVTLTGTVKNTEAEETALNIASGIDGVKKVNVKVRLQPNKKK